MSSTRTSEDHHYCPFYVAWYLLHIEALAIAAMARLLCSLNVQEVSGVLLVHVYGEVGHKGGTNGQHFDGKRGDGG